MKALALALVAICLSTDVLALSCMRPDPVQDYKNAVASDHNWIVVRGVLRFDEAGLPKGGVLNQTTTPPMTDLPARFSGHVLTASGFDRALDTEITLRVTCAGPWCGGARDGMTALAFLKEEAGRHVWIADPCGTRVYSDPRPSDLKRIQACARGEPCEPAALVIQ